ncbi:MAG: hypothetical protein E6J70_07850 [Deltaproteobacteria bacterium]|nr:MAG: hypothetical protein E6J70_07850 [Deltaproteobacteria bacterium]
MPRPDAAVEAQIAAFTRDVQAALGDRLVSLVLYGSAVGDDWVTQRSDLNVAVVVPRVTLDVLEALVPVIARWRRKRLALPLVADREYLESARDAFPMELDDICRHHRVLAGADPFGGLVIERAALRRECEHEARGKLLRLRALFLDAAGRPAALEQLMVESLKSFLVVLRHLLRLRGAGEAHGYREVLAAGAGLLGPLPVMQRLLDRRAGDARLGAAALREEFGGYLAEVERIVAALDALDA